MMKQTLLACITVVVLFFSACTDRNVHYQYAALDQNLSLEDENIEALSRAFLEYWDAVSRHDFNLSYRYELPYIRFLKPFEEYKAESNVLLKHFHVTMKSYECEDNGCRVVEVTREFRVGKKRRLFRSKWIRLDGKWYHKYDFSLFPTAY